MGEEELDFRRIRIKKQMLGNIKFIGQLFKKNLLKEKIMRYCIASLLKLEELPIKSKNPEYKDSGDLDMDEEDHEAICSMFTTIGLTIDKPNSASFMTVCWTKISNLSTNKKLPSRSRFMYKDLMDLRKNKWVPRRKEEKAKTLEEIKKDFEREERKQAEQSAQNDRRGGNQSNYRGGGRDNNNNRGSGDYRQNDRRANSSMRQRQPKVQQTTDDDGFTTIAKGGGGGGAGGGGHQVRGRGPAPPPVTSKPSAFAALDDDGPSKKSSSNNNNNSSSKKAKALDEDQLKRRFKSIRSDFMTGGGDVKELSATPESGLKMVQTYCDQLLDSKEAERVAISKILAICAEKKWISSEDAKGGLLDGIEFIDSMIYDCPKAYEYIGEILANFLRIGLIDVAWYCDATEKTKVDPGTKAPVSLTKAIIQSMKSSGAGDMAKDKFGSANAALVKLMGQDAWSEVSKEL